jgi:hypothetical protein
MILSMPDTITYILMGAVGWLLMRAFTANRCLGRIEQALIDHIVIVRRFEEALIEHQKQDTVHFESLGQKLDKMVGGK